MSDGNKSFGGLLADGLFGSNPVLRLGLGLCPALAVTVHAQDALAFAIAAACALVLSNLCVSLLREILPVKGRGACCLVVSAVSGCLAHMVLGAYFPQVNASLGVYPALIAVSTLLIGRAGMFAGEHGPGQALADGIGMGLGYILALTLIGIVRELIGCGTLFGARVLPTAYEPMLLLAMPAGGLLVCGLLMGLWNRLRGESGKGKEGDQA